MGLIKTFTTLSEIKSAWLNLVQSRTLLQPGTGTAAAGDPSLDPTPGATAAALDGNGLALVGQVMRFGFVDSGATPSMIANSKLLVLDDSVDWRDRMLLFFYHAASGGLGAASMPGGASDTDYRNNASNGGGVYATDEQGSPIVSGRPLYTGLGCGSSANAAVNPASGAPPPAAFAAYAGRFIVPLLGPSGGSQYSTNLFLYVERNSPYRLCVYNTYPGNVTLQWMAMASSKLGKR